MCHWIILSCRYINAKASQRHLWGKSSYLAKTLTFRAKETESQGSAIAVVTYLTSIYRMHIMDAQGRLSQPSDQSLCKPNIMICLKH